MKKIEVSQCEYCKKIYINPNSCRSHEYTCYYNPRTESCASCSFFKFENIEYKEKHTQLYSYPACLLNIPIGTKGLRTKCKKYLDVKYQDDPKIMEPVYKKYDFQKQAIARIKKVKLSKYRSIDLRSQ